jgi:hypothetical protein
MAASMFSHPIRLVIGLGIVLAGMAVLAFHGVPAA